MAMPFPSMTRFRRPPDLPTPEQACPPWRMPQQRNAIHAHSKACRRSPEECRSKGTPFMLLARHADTALANAAARERHSCSWQGMPTQPWQMPHQGNANHAPGKQPCRMPSVLPVGNQMMIHTMPPLLSFTIFCMVSWSFNGLSSPITATLAVIPSFTSCSTVFPKIFVSQIPFSISA